MFRLFNIYKSIYTLFGKRIKYYINLKKKNQLRAKCPQVPSYNVRRVIVWVEIVDHVHYFRSTISIPIFVNIFCSPLFLSLFIKMILFKKSTFITSFWSLPRMTCYKNIISFNEQQWWNSYVIKSLKSCLINYN